MHSNILRRLAPCLLLCMLAGDLPVCYGSNNGLADSPPASTFDYIVAKAWMDLVYTLVKTQPGHSPPVASRVYAYTSVALYESIVHGAPDHRSLAGQLNGLTVDAVPKPVDTVHHWPAVANSAAATVLTSFFPGAAPQIATLAQRFAAQFAATLSPDVLGRSIQYGLEVAHAILAWAATDGFAALSPCSAAFALPTVSGAWTGSGTGLQPCWGTLRTFAVANGSACAASGHPAYSTSTSSTFYDQALLVYITTGNAGAHLTPEQKHIANFWADNPTMTGTPPGHWVAITGIVAAQAGLSLNRTAEAYARVGIAVADAFITCWKTKFDTNLLRPVTYIRTHINAAWEPFIPTPNFPTYPSGHSAQSGAAATVLSGLLGRRAFTDTTHSDLNPDLGYPDRAFADFYAAANEAAVSRLYGGIHYLFDNKDGFAQGVCNGTHINTTIEFTKPQKSNARQPASARRQEAGKGRPTTLGSH
jgi:membrane-associated phospholipid phosphatase